LGTKSFGPEVDLAIVELFVIQLWEFISHPYESEIKSFLCQLVLSEEHF
jgi:hypothetical protein